MTVKELIEELKKIENQHKKVKAMSFRSYIEELNDIEQDGDYVYLVNGFEVY